MKGFYMLTYIDGDGVGGYHLDYCANTSDAIDVLRGYAADDCGAGYEEYDCELRERVLLKRNLDGYREYFNGVSLSVNIYTNKASREEMVSDILYTLMGDYVEVVTLKDGTVEFTMDKLPDNDEEYEDVYFLEDEEKDLCEEVYSLIDSPDAVENVDSELADHWAI